MQNVITKSTVNRWLQRFKEEWIQATNFDVVDCRKEFWIWYTMGINKLINRYEKCLAGLAIISKSKFYLENKLFLVWGPFVDFLQRMDRQCKTAPTDFFVRNWMLRNFYLKFRYNVYFWQCSALKWINFAIFVHFLISKILWSPLALLWWEIDICAH